MILLYRRDRVEKEPAGLLLLLLIGGVLSCIPAIFLESFLEPILQSVYVSAFTYYLIDAFIVVALSEEFSKYIFLKLFSWKNKNFNSSFDGILYAAFTSTGFALGENLLYVFQYGMDTGITRSYTAIPAHVAFGILMGISYSAARKHYLMGDMAGAKSLRITGIISAVIAHGAYDFCLFIGSSFFILVWYGVLALLYVIIFLLTKHYSKKDELFYHLPR